jgi:CMP-N-acetylneuraminic acid synthetase
MLNNNIALIPARKGSKRFPGKNTASLCGKPLICWTIEAAITSATFDRIIVSSDDDAVINISKQYKDIEIHKREPELALDETTVFTVLRYLIDEKFSPNEMDGICTILLPTCPFRTAEDIINAEKLMDSDVDIVLSVKQYQESPQIAFSIDKNKNAFPGWPNSPLSRGKTRSQDFQPLYHPNTGIYMAWIQSFIRLGTFFKGRIKAHLMPEHRSIDIDTEMDLMFAKLIYSTLIKGNK